MSQNNCTITTTTGLADGALATDLLPNQSLEDWVITHKNAVKQATASGDPLTTSWNNKSGLQSEVTTRDAGPPAEALADFVTRHVTDFLLEMIQEQPDT